MKKPKVFIGSSAEGESVAEALAQGLSPKAEPLFWRHGAFPPAEYSLASLVQTIRSCDFAVMVLTPDDPVRKRDRPLRCPRDNVIFELGLCMGILGVARTFMLYNEDNRPDLPTDLEGITAVTYAGSTRDSLRPAVGVASATLRVAFDRVLVDPKIRLQGARSRPVVYWCAPHRNVDRNKNVRQYLESAGIGVTLPGELVTESQVSAVGGDQRRAVREVCTKAILESDCVVVDLDLYGLDSAWEMGFAEARQIRVIGVSQDLRVLLSRRKIHRRVFSDNFMHGWHIYSRYDSLTSIEGECRGKSVYVCGSFQNENAMARLRASGLDKTARSLILPKDLLKLGDGFPSAYPLRAKEAAISLLAGADVAVVILPRYGMDTSWQIGYAAALDKPIIGWEAEEGGPDKEVASVWDHWMHGWKEKVTFTNLKDAAAFIQGLELRGPG